LRRDGVFDLFFEFDGNLEYDTDASTNNAGESWLLQLPVLDKTGLDRLLRLFGVIDLLVLLLLLIGDGYDTGRGDPLLCQ
jgi:hypothetical protein